MLLLLPLPECTISNAQYTHPLRKTLPSLCVVSALCLYHSLAGIVPVFALSFYFLFSVFAKQTNRTPDQRQFPFVHFVVVVVERFSIVAYSHCVHPVLTVLHRKKKTFVFVARSFSFSFLLLPTAVTIHFIHIHPWIHLSQLIVVNLPLTRSLAECICMCLCRYCCYFLYCASFEMCNSHFMFHSQGWILSSDYRLTVQYVFRCVFCTVNERTLLCCWATFLVGSFVWQLNTPIIIAFMHMYVQYKPFRAHIHTYTHIVLHCILENEYTNICAHLEHYPRTYHFLFSPPSESLALSLQTKLTEQKILHNENVKMFIFTRSFRTNSRFCTFQSNFQFIQSNSAHTQHQTKML